MEVPKYTVDWPKKSSAICTLAWGFQRKLASSAEVGYRLLEKTTPDQAFRCGKRH